MADEDFHKQPTLHKGKAHEPAGPLPSAELPKTIGPYKIESLLEKGGMSVIYLAVHPETKELTTVKALLPKYLSHPDVVQRFLNEAEIIAMSDHPNIVKLYGHGEWAGGLYIAMEYIQGLSLRQVLLESPISLKRALEIVTDIAYALCHLHTHGVIHRDLKPENILITDDGGVKVIDFGIAQLLTEKNPKDSPPTQRLIGTPIYMSPEQREDPESVSYPSDIYSLGIIAYELVLGKLSHGQIHLSLMPKGLQKILAKALQSKPQDRYLDIVDFITDITAYIHSPGFEKESHPADHLYELLENLRKGQRLILAPETPEWAGYTLALGLTGRQNSFGSYHDFFSLSDGPYAALQVQTTVKSAEGAILAAMVRGIFRTLIRQTHDPVRLAEELNRQLVQDKIDSRIALNFLLLLPEENRLSFFSSGNGLLWKIPGKEKKGERVLNVNKLLGETVDATFSAAESPFGKGDRLILCVLPSATDVAAAESFITSSLAEIEPGIDIQQLIDTLLRRTKYSFAPNSRPLFLLGIDAGR